MDTSSNTIQEPLDLSTMPQESSIIQKEPLDLSNNTKDNHVGQQEPLDLSIQQPLNLPIFADAFPEVIPKVYIFYIVYLIKMNHLYNKNIYFYIFVYYKMNHLYNKIYIFYKCITFLTLFVSGKQCTTSEHLRYIRA